ncbi:MAG: hypothetical protein GX282_06260 [Campylobacteraceae bacterium]|nr:hypothetical protein [Campylobacteraceae bacterium]
MENQKSEQCLYLDEFKNIVNLEAKIIELISCDLNDNIIYMQFKNLKVMKREASISGYYCYFEDRKDMQKTINSGFVGNVNLISNNESIGGAMILIEGGILKMIECYFWDESNFFVELLKTNQIKT